MNLETNSAQTQTETTMDDIDKLIEEKLLLKEKVEDPKKMGRENFISLVTESDVNCMFYTGVPTVVLLRSLFCFVSSFSNQVNYWKGSKHKQQSYQNLNGKEKTGPKRILTPFQEYILTLVRIRLGLLNRHVADIFGVSPTTSSNTFTTWVNLLYHVLKPVLKWPSREAVNKHMPAPFSKHFKRTRAVVDCTEFYIQRPRNVRSQAATYSTYKSRNTLKALLGISPVGAITFLSNLWSGNTSDRMLFKKCGILDVLEPGDAVMADRGFTVRDLLAEKSCHLVMPPFTKKFSGGKGKKLTTKDVVNTRNIANCRIHVERAIQRVKTFKILNGQISLSLKPLLEQILMVVCVITNLWGPLIKK